MPNSQQQEHPGPPEIPEHTLLRQIGRGSYGEVWLGRNTFGQFRAVKIIYRNRFDEDRPYERELTAIEKVEPITRKHTGLVDILQVGRSEGYFYYIMELADDADGKTEVDPDCYQPKTLSSEVGKRGRLPLAEVVSTGCTVAQSLAFLHDQELVHRDVKLSNVIFVEGRAKLADVGLVASANASFSLVGTYGYIPREGPGKPPADIYALGKMLYEMATGKDRSDFPEIDVLDPSMRGLNRIMLKACEELPEERYPHAQAMADDLMRLEDGGESMAEKMQVDWGLSATKIGLLALVAIVVLAIYNWPKGASTLKQDLDFPNRKDLLTTKINLTNGLIAYFPFDGNANDMSGRGLHGQPYGVKLAADRTGKPNSAYQFNGPDSYIVVPSATELNLSGPFTVSLWFTVEGSSPRGWMHLISKHRPSPGAAGDGFGISIPGPSSLKANLFFSFSQIQLNAPASFYPYNPDIWHHVLVASDGKKINAYLNNILADTTNFNGTLSPNNEPLTIGGQNRGFDQRNHVGKIDDVRIYNRALTAGEIEALFKLKQPDK